MGRRLFVAFALSAVVPAICADAQTNCTSYTSGQVCRITATAVTMSASSNVTYAWDNTTASPRSQAIGFACNTVPNGFSFTVKDEVGTAGTIPITITPVSGDKIDTGTAPFVLTTSYESITFQCDGNVNWLVE